MSRRDLLAMIHLGPKNLGWDEDTRRAWLQKHTGKRSSKDCSDAELVRCADLLRKLGALDDGRPIGKADRGGKGGNRPTREQWKKLAVLCKKREWPEGIDDAGLAAFVRRVAKVDNPRFLTREQIGHVIVGLNRWIEHDLSKGD